MISLIGHDSRLRENSEVVTQIYIISTSMACSKSKAYRVDPVSKDVTHGAELKNLAAFTMLRTCYTL